MYKYYYRFLLLLLQFALFDDHALAEEPSIQQVDRDEVVVLCGIVKIENRWGPPEFGARPKSDSKFLNSVLVLDVPTIFRHQSEGGAEIDEGLTSVAISTSANFPRHALSQYSSKRVKLLGKLWSASSQGDTTPVVASPESIEIISAKSICKR
jgi:hypothetical protein